MTIAAKVLARGDEVIERLPPYGTKRTCRAGRRCLLIGGQSGSRVSGQSRAAFDPNVWSGRALQEVFVELA